MVSYKASKVTDATKVHSFSKKGYVLIAVIAMASLFKFKHDFSLAKNRTVEKSNSSSRRSLFNLHDVARFSQQALNSDWQQYLNTSTWPLDSIDAFLNDTLAQVD
jgi:hypothetical protein